MNKKQKYLIWMILCIAYIIVFFHRFMAGAVKNSIIDTFDISFTTFSNLCTMFFYAYIVMQLPAGILADTIGPKKTVSIGMLLAGISSIIFGFSPNIYAAFAARLLVGLGVSVVYISILKFISIWFDEKEFATISGITAFMGNIGGILAQSPLVILSAIITWRYTFDLVGIISLIVAMLCFLLVKDSPEEKRISKPSTSDILRVISAVCKNKLTWPLFLMYTFFYGSYFAIIGIWGISYLSKVYGITSIKAGNYTILAVLGYAISSGVLGAISDKLQKRKLPMIILGIVFISIWGVLIIYNNGKPPIEWMGILFFTLGVSASTFSLVWTCGKEVNNPAFAGISTSIINIGGCIGAILVSVLMGVILDSFEDSKDFLTMYNHAFRLCALSSILGFISLLFIKETNCKNVFHQNDETVL